MISNRLTLFSKIVKSNFAPRSLPYKLIFSITKECHSRCLNCNIWKSKPHNELSLREIIQIAENSSFLSWLNLTGGEVTDHPNLVEIISAFIKNCPDLALINFPTNGINTKRIVEKCQAIAKLNIPETVVIVSLDGPPEVNDRLRGIRNDFEHAVQTYIELRKIKKIKTMIGMTLYQDNHHLIDETILEIRKRLPQFSENDFHLNIQTQSEHLYENKDQENQKSLAMVASIETFAQNRNWHRLNPFQFIERKYLQHIRSYVESGKTPVNCAATHASLYLSEKGEVFPCTVWSRSLGNIRNSDYSFLPILRKTAELDELRQKILEKKCPGCWSPCEASHSLVSQFNI